MVCALCEEQKISYRSCMFGTKRKDICSDCLSQWKVHKVQVEQEYVVLIDRYAKAETLATPTSAEGVK